MARQQALKRSGRRSALNVGAHGQVAANRARIGNALTSVILQGLYAVVANIHKPLAVVAHIAVIVGIGFTVARATMFFAFGPQSAPVAPTVVSQPANSPVSVHIEEVAGWHLFGRPPADFNAAPQTEKLPETRLSLELIGVFVANDSTSSAALIAGKGQAPKKYRVGDRVPGDAKLAAVFQDHVVISRGGVREQIRFRERKAVLQPVKALRPVEAQAADPAVYRTGAASVEEAMPSPGDSPSARALTVLRDELGRDPNRLLADMGVARVSDEGARGYAIGALADHPDLSHVGLQRGDRVLSVNGRAVGDPAQDRLRIEDIIAEGSARIEIERGGQRLAVTVSLN